MQLLTEEICRTLPYLGEKNGDSVARVKFFTPDSSWTWYASEFDGDDILYGLVDGFEVEFGTFSLKELQAVRGPLGLPIERDVSFTPIPLDQLYRELRGTRAIR